MGIRIKLTLLFSLLLTTSLVLASLVEYQFARQQLLLHLQKESNAITQEEVARLDFWLQRKAISLEQTASLLPLLPRSPETLQPLLARQMSLDSDISDLYFGTENGEVVDGSHWQPPSGYDPRKRPWYRQALLSADRVFIEPYMDLVTNQYTISIAKQVRLDNQDLAGVLSQDVPLSRFLEYIRHIQPFDGGYAFLLDQRGIILAHPDPSLQSLDINQAEPLRSLPPQMRSDLLRKSEGFLEYSFQNEDRLAYFGKLPSTGWTLVITLPRSYLDEPLRELLLRYLFLTCFAQILTLFCIHRLANQFIRPLESLTLQARQVSGAVQRLQDRLDAGENPAQLSNWLQETPPEPFGEKKEKQSMNIEQE